MAHAPPFAPSWQNRPCRLPVSCYVHGFPGAAGGGCVDSYWRDHADRDRLLVRGDDVEIEVREPTGLSRIVGPHYCIKQDGWVLSP